jgi:dynein heavy chain
LEEKLFMLQDHFSTHLAKHRTFMIEMEKQRFIDPCITGDTKSIEEFADAQVDKTENIQEEILKFSDRCRENIRECISKVLSELRTRIVSEIALDEERKKNNPIQSSNTITMKKKATSNTFEKLGFPEGMTYGHRSGLRKECSRFLRFAYLVDFLSLEALANIYTGSVRDMIDRLEQLDVDCNMNDVMNADFADQQGATGHQRGSEPLFRVETKLVHEEEIPANEIHDYQIEPFVLPPRGTSKTEDFDLLAHLELEPEKEEGAEEESEEEGEKSEAEAAPPIYRKVVPNI